MTSKGSLEGEEELSKTERRKEANSLEKITSERGGRGKKLRDAKLRKGNFV